MGVGSNSLLEDNHIIEYGKDTRAGRIVRVHNGPPNGYVTDQRGVLCIDVGTGAFHIKRNSRYGPFITLGNGSPQNVRVEREGTLYLDIASNTIGAPHKLYVNTTGLVNGWTDITTKVYININGTSSGWVKLS